MFVPTSWNVPEARYKNMNTTNEEKVRNWIKKKKSGYRFKSKDIAKATNVMPYYSGFVCGILVGEGKLKSLGRSPGGPFVWEVV